MKDKLSLVLSGGFVKGVAHISIAEEMYNRDYIPDVFVGTSIGAVFSVLFGLYDDPKIVKQITQGFIKSHIWLQLVSIDILSKAGLFESKEAIKLVSKEAGFAGMRFKDLKKPVYVTSTDLNTGKLILFGKDRDMLLSEALEASISFPVIFKPKKLRIKGKVMALADGGIRENCPISIAAKIPGVKRIIACDLGYCGQSKGDFNKQNALDVFMQCLDLTTSFSQINRYINDEIFIKNRISVRIINPGIFDVQPFEFKRIPGIMSRAGVTARKTFGSFDDPDRFFTYWRSRKINIKGIKVEHIGQKQANAFEIVDIRRK